MKLAIRFATVAGLAVATSGALLALAGPASAQATTQHHSGPAVFVQTDGLAGNAVVAYDRAWDGTLTQAGTYATGGLGGALSGSVVDHLASQGSLGYDSRHHLLYAVNAGSDTLSVFRVHGDRLKLEQVIGSGGSFPVSVTVHNDVVYVLNARNGGSIQGYVSLGGHLVMVGGWHRGLGLDATLTPEFTHTPGQVLFSPDGSQLIVTTKANGSDIDVFAVGRLGAPSSVPVVNSEPGTVPFAVTFDPAGHLVVGEAGTNAVASFSVSRAGRLTPIAVVPTGQAATCWIVRAGGKVYASNAGSAALTEVTVGAAGQLTKIGDTATDGGTVDAAVSSDGRFLYVQAGAAGMVDEFRINSDGSLTSIGALTVPGAIGGEGIVAR
jgi:6-phosphogluconolactonase (cycloisomerase 2 family)